MTQTPFKTTKGSFLAVTGLPEDINSYGLGIEAMHSGRPYLSYDRKKLIGWDKRILLPPGQWEIIGWSDKLSEEQMADICELYVEFMGDIYCIKKSFDYTLISNNIPERALILKLKTS